MNDEKWKDVIGFEGMYQISNKGQVMSLPRNSVAYEGKRPLLTRQVGGYLLSQVLSKRGYPFVALMKNKKAYRKMVHRLVAEAFIPNPENKPQVKQNDGNKTNACVENLQWCTVAENNNHTFLIAGRAGFAREIVQKDFKGNVIKVWDSINDAFLGTGIKKALISKSCRSKISAGGFLWEYYGLSRSEKKAKVNEATPKPPKEATGFFIEEES